MHWGFEVIRFTAIMKSIKISKHITVFGATEASGVISIVERATRKSACKDYTF